LLSYKPNRLYKPLSGLLTGDVPNREVKSTYG